VSIIRLQSWKWIIALSLLVTSSVKNAHGDVRRVDKHATGTPVDGTTWARAYRDLQAALTTAAPGTEIWVAAETYLPGSAPGNAFELREHVFIYGGFLGTRHPTLPNGETELSQRDFVNNVTVLSGEIGDPAEIDDNCYSVVLSNLISDSRLDGFTITGASRHGVQVSGGSPRFQNLRIVGNRNYDESLPYNDRDGAGMYLVNSAQPTLTNCAFEYNEAYSQGGGLYIAQGCRPFLTACQFRYNLASEGGGIWNGSGQTVATLPRLNNCLFRRNGYRAPPAAPVGAGVAIFNHPSADVVVRDSVFTDNTALGAGGAIHTVAGSYTNCVFVHNETQAAGGAVHLYNDRSEFRAVLANCRFVGNTSSSYGGAADAQGSGLLVNCLFAGNKSGAGGGLYTWARSLQVAHCTFVQNRAASTVGGGMSVDWSAAAATILVRNSILWENTDAAGDGESAQLYDENAPDGPASVLYTCLQGLDLFGDQANHNIGDDLQAHDPDFITPLTGAWTAAPVFEPAGYPDRTKLTDANAAWTPGALVGCVVACTEEWECDGRPLTVIAANTATELYVWGDFSELWPSGYDYAIYDYRLTSGSPCLDTASRTYLPEDLGDLDEDSDTEEDTPLDLELLPRMVGAADILGLAKCDAVDMGAFEYQVGCSWC